jgi:hypothetical protein
MKVDSHSKSTQPEGVVDSQGSTCNLGRHCRQAEQRVIFQKHIVGIFLVLKEKSPYDVILYCAKLF